MTKTKAATKKAASKKTAAAKPAKKATSAKAKKPASAKAPKAKPTAKQEKPAKKAKATKPVEVVAAKAAPSRVEKSTPAASKPAPARVASSKPAADFGAGLTSTPVAAKVAEPKPAAPKAEPRAAAKPMAEKPTAPKPAAPAAASAPSPANTATAVADDVGIEAGEVPDFLRASDHPRVADFTAVRKLILEASPSIEEGIKWNAPSFRTSEWFATFHLRDPHKVQVVFHLGAKKRETSQRIPVGAPEGMVEWLAPDRCMVTVDDVKRRGKALQAFVRGWILHV